MQSLSQHRSQRQPTQTAIFNETLPKTARAPLRIPPLIKKLVSCSVSAPVSRKTSTDDGLLRRKARIGVLPRCEVEACPLLSIWTLHKSSKETNSHMSVYWWYNDTYWQEEYLQGVLIKKMHEEIPQDVCMFNTFIPFNYSLLSLICYKLFTFLAKEQLD